MAHFDSVRVEVRFCLGVMEIRQECSQLSSKSGHDLPHNTSRSDNMKRRILSDSSLERGSAQRRLCCARIPNGAAFRAGGIEVQGSLHSPCLH